MNLLIKRLMFWIRESTLRAKFRLYERWPALFPHALDIDEQYEELPEDAAELEILELHFEEHRAAEPTLEPRRTMIFSSYNSKKKCNFLTAKYYKRLIAKDLHWALERGFTNILVDYTTPYGLLALETFLPLKTSEVSFQLFSIKTRLISDRKSFRLIPETNAEIDAFIKKCDYNFSQYLPEETLSLLFSNAGVLSNESGTIINSRWIPHHLIDAWR